MAFSKNDFAISGTVILDNGIYRVFVTDTPGTGIGRYGMQTSTNHPAGPNQTLIFSAFHTIRSYTSFTDYVQTTFTGFIPDPPFTVISIDPAGSTGIPSTTSVDTTYTLTQPTYNDNMTVLQNITILGTTINDSRVAITTSITNIGIAPLSIGIRYHWDTDLDGDVGPTFQQLNPTLAPLTNEATFNFPAFEAYQLQNDTGTPVITLKGSVNGPAALSPSPVPQDRIQYAYLGNSPNHSFSFTTNPATVASDSTVSNFWGANTPIIINPGQTATVRTLLFNNVQQQARGLHFC